jgi:hypothetical protein
VDQGWVQGRAHALYAGSNLDKAWEVYAAAIYHRPRIRLIIRQRLQSRGRHAQRAVGAIGTLISCWRTGTRICADRIARAAPEPHLQLLRLLVF